ICPSYTNISTASKSSGTVRFIGDMTSSEAFDVKVLTDKLSKLNSSQQTLSCWCITHRKKARVIVEKWDKLLNAAQKERWVSFLFLANDILQNSRRKGTEFVNEFWKVLPGALKKIYNNGDENDKKAVTRLVGIWEERKVFGSRAQNLKSEILGGDPSAQVVSNGKISNPIPNPIKIVKKDAQSLRIKLAVGDSVEKIVTAFHSVHDEFTNEQDALTNCRATILSVERIEKEVDDTLAKGIPPDSTVLDQLQEQESVLQACVQQLKSAEASRTDLLSQLRAAVHDQEEKLGIIHGQLEAARTRIEDAGHMKQKVSSLQNASSMIFSSTDPPKAPENGPATVQTVASSFPVIQSTAGLQLPVQLPQQSPSKPATSFAALASTEEDNKKATAAALAAMLTASTSSALMLTSALSSLVAEEAAARNGNLGNSGFTTSSLAKRQRLESDGSNGEMGSAGYPTTQRHPMPIWPPTMPPVSPATQMPTSMAPSPPRPPPPMPPNQFLQSSGMMLGPMTHGHGYTGSRLPPSPLPPLPSPHQHQQQLQPPQSHQKAGTGAYYGPPGFGSYVHNHQPSPPPVHRQ
ncbi:Regulation of nuclear pre-mRNA domain-containing protein, partial [Drosera capensis]